MGRVHVRPGASARCSDARGPRGFGASSWLRAYKNVDGSLLEPISDGRAEDRAHSPGQWLAEYDRAVRGADNQSRSPGDPGKPEAPGRPRQPDPLRPSAPTGR